MIERFEVFASSINRIYRCVQKIKSSKMTEFGLKGTQVMCLVSLMKNQEGFTSAELSNICMEDKGAISRAVSNLEEKGLVVFDEQAGKRRYRAKIRLTEEGRNAAGQIVKIIEKSMLQAGNGLSDEEINIFYKGLDIISDNLLKICGDKGD